MEATPAALAQFAAIDISDASSSHLVALPEDLITRVLSHALSHALFLSGRTCRTLHRCCMPAAWARLSHLQTLYQLDDATSSEPSLVLRLRALERAAVDASQSYSVVLSKSKGLAENQLKLVLSQVAWVRGLFPKESFVSRQTLGLTLSVLSDGRPSGRFGNRNLLPSAERTSHPSLQQLLDRLEKRAFVGLAKGYLERVSLVVSHDAAAKDIAETWAVRVVWRSGPPGNLEAYPATVELLRGGDGQFNGELSALTSGVAARTHGHEQAGAAALAAVVR